MSRKTLEGQCHRCGEDILTGYDADRGGLFAVLDDTPVAAAFEAWALIAGWETYWLNSAGQITHRTHWHIAANRQNAIHVDHQCGRHAPEAWQIPPPDAPAAAIDPNVIPF